MSDYYSLATTTTSENALVASVQAINAQLYHARVPSVVSQLTVAVCQLNVILAAYRFGTEQVSIIVGRDSVQQASTISAIISSSDIVRTGSCGDLRDRNATNENSAADSGCQRSTPTAQQQRKHPAEHAGTNNSHTGRSTARNERLTNAKQTVHTAVSITNHSVMRTHTKAASTSRTLRFNGNTNCQQKIVKSTTGRSN